LTVSGTLAIGSNQAPLATINSNTSARAVVAYVKTAPTGANLILNINIGGFLWMSLAIVAGTTTAEATPSQIAAVSTIQAGSLVTLDITAVGTTVPGSDLSVLIYL
jgi:hypothetical protein